ncbi:hypothetical protein ACTID9_21795 [Brevibacillus fluminis]|uniref:hypothetical protein n=1 Tax=Brevibacillus fluminis TaxID=511487 RepID=UPI003F89BB4C
MPELDGIGYGLVVRHFAEASVQREKAALAEIRKVVISILGAKEDRGETFVWWKQRGRPDMYRVSDKALSSAAQKNLDEMLEKK